MYCPSPVRLTSVHSMPVVVKASGVALVFLAALNPLVVKADEEPTKQDAPAVVASFKSNSNLDEVVVFGRGEELIGKADAASEGSVGGADLSVRPLLRVAELLEVVPGLIAAQHSGSGKANQYFLRGFNLDHGRSEE